MTLTSDFIDRLPYVEGVLNYLAPIAERPVNLAYEPPPGAPRSTGVPEPHRIPIHDARPIAARCRSYSPPGGPLRSNPTDPLLPPCAGRVELCTVAEARLLDPLGTVHGGWAMTMLDSATGLAPQTTIELGEIGPYHETSVKFVRPPAHSLT